MLILERGTSDYLFVVFWQIRSNWIFIWRAQSLGSLMYVVSLEWELKVSVFFPAILSIPIVGKDLRKPR